jgi:ribosomal protein S18 acetylase RimI-like enzyme
MPGPLIRPSTIEEAPALAKVHREAFPGFFLTSLGERFLTQLYRSFASSAQAICLVACSDDAIVGFVAGPLRPKAFFRQLLVARGPAFAVAAIPSLLRNPMPVARRLVAAVFYRGEAPAQSGAALVSSICVTPSAQGGGVAGRLLEEFCSAASARGARYVYLTTDRDANDRANAFYERAGFSLEAEVARDGERVMNRYIKDLSTHDGL